MAYLIFIMVAAFDSQNKNHLLKRNNNRVIPHEEIMTTENKNLNSTELAQQVGIDKFTCPKCGGKMSGMEALKHFFESIVLACRDGAKVRIHGLGIFEAKLHKGRIISSPVLKGGKSKSKDQLVLSFRHSPGSKRLLNPGMKGNGGKKNG